MLFLFSLLACSDYELVDENDNTGQPEKDSGVDCPPSIPDCNDTGEIDTSIPVDTGTVDPDCEVIIAPAGTVDIDEECDGTTGVSGSIKDAFDLSIEHQYNRPQAFL